VRTSPSSGSLEKMSSQLRQSETDLLQSFDANN
jgi:hypothetical protein